MFPFFTPEQIAEWEASVAASEMGWANIPIIGKKNRCIGCGQFMPKNLETITYININNDPCHMNEKCMNKALEGKTV